MFLYVQHSYAHLPQPLRRRQRAPAELDHRAQGFLGRGWDGGRGGGGGSFVGLRDPSSSPVYTNQPKKQCSLREVTKRSKRRGMSTLRRARHTYVRLLLFAVVYCVCVLVVVSSSSINFRGRCSGKYRYVHMSANKCLLLSFLLSFLLLILAGISPWSTRCRAEQQQQLDAKI